MLHTIFFLKQSILYQYTEAPEVRNNCSHGPLCTVTCDSWHYPTGTAHFLVHSITISYPAFQVCLFPCHFMMNVQVVLMGDPMSTEQVQGQGQGQKETVCRHDRVAPHNEEETDGTRVAHVTIQALGARHLERQWRLQVQIVIIHL